MTGAYIRIERNGTFENVEIEHLTKDEFRQFFADRPEDMMKWLEFFHSYLGDLAHCMED